MIEIWVRNEIGSETGHAPKPKLVLMLVLILKYLGRINLSIINPRDTFVNYSTVVTFKQDFDRILYEYLCSFKIVPSRHNCGIVSIFCETITARFLV
jgi:hypothetical protein